MENVHHECITRPIMTDNTKILRRFNDPVRLGIADELFIEANAPAINLQAAGFKKKLLSYFVNILDFISIIIHVYLFIYFIFLNLVSM